MFSLQAILSKRRNNAGNKKNHLSRLLGVPGGQHGVERNKTVDALAKQAAWFVLLELHEPHKNISNIGMQMAEAVKQKCFT